MIEGKSAIPGCRAALEAHANLEDHLAKHEGLETLQCLRQDHPRPVSPLQMTVLLRLNAQCRHVVCRDETTPRTLNQGARNNWADLKRALWGF